MTPVERVQALTGHRMGPVQARRHLEQRAALLAQIEQERSAAVARCLENLTQKGTK